MHYGISDILLCLVISLVEMNINCPNPLHFLLISFPNEDATLWDN